MNLLLRTDVYKTSHHEQYPPKTSKIYSYLEARKSREDGLDYTVFFGLQYYLKQYLKPITHEDVDEFQEVMTGIMGRPLNVERFHALADLGYLPIKIKAVKEGTVMPLQNVLMTITNTHPDYYWLVNYLETLLMKLWLPITVASNSYRFRRLFNGFADRTVGNRNHVPFQMHDFGYRGCGSEESAAIAGAAHLTSFLGTDTVAAVTLLKDYYSGGVNGKPIGLSVPASEHSSMTSWTTNNDDYDAIENMLNVYQDGIVSIVSDSYNLWRVITEYFGTRLKDRIMARNGKVVCRPDCFCDQTSILTPSGWKLFADLTDEDMVAQVTDEGEYEFVKPLEVVRQPYQGKMHRFKDHHGKVDLLVTPNHRMVWRRQNGSLFIQEAEKCGSTAHWNKSVLRGVPAQPKGKPLTALERLFIAFQADGSFPSKDKQGANFGAISGTRCIRFNFTKKRKADRLIAICEEGGFKHTVKREAARPQNYNIYVWLDKDVKVLKDFSWVDISDLCADWCSDFVEELSHWDATIRNDHRIKFDTTTPEVAKVVELIALSAGKGVLLTIMEDNRKKHFSDVYCLHIMDSNTLDGAAINHTIVDYDGMVYCVKVPTGKVLVKRGRGTAVSGNSGDPVLITCGNPSAETTEEQFGVVRLLDRYFGSSWNSKGFREIDPHVGTIYGDAIFYNRAQEILSRLAGMGYASNNIVFGSGGLLLNQWSRDTLGMAIKATYCEVDGEERPIEKNPITDTGKKSKRGLLRLTKEKTAAGLTFKTKDNCSQDEEEGGELETVFENGQILRTQTIDEIRSRLEELS